MTSLSPLAPLTTRRRCTNFTPEKPLPDFCSFFHPNTVFRLECNHGNCKVLPTGQFIGDAPDKGKTLLASSQEARAGPQGNSGCA
jgi:hypothetical protein